MTDDEPHVHHWRAGPAGSGTETYEATCTGCSTVKRLPGSDGAGPGRGHREIYFRGGSVERPTTPRRGLMQ